VKGLLVPRPEPGAALERELLALHERYFEVDPGQFRRDLAEKDWVVLVRDDGGRLLGFSTLRVERVPWQGDTLGLLSSGDTVTSPEVWRSTVLSRTWIGAVRRIQAAQPAGRLFWLLLVSGFRTYRFLPVFWREFHPRFDRPTPAPTRALMDALARHRYGACFDAEAGVVRFPRPSVLCDGLRGVPVERQLDPHVDFFLARNPGHERGDELVCLTEIRAENLTPAGLRMVRAAGAGALP
jgi:hypothetical protein